MHENLTPVTIKLTHGTLIVDAIDADLLLLGWHSYQDKRTCYAVRNIHLDGVRTTRSIHRMILTRAVGRPLESREHSDHINGDGLDNRRENLRVSSQQENHRNRTRVRRDSSSGVTGVSWNKKLEKWQAYIRMEHPDGTRYNSHLGVFRDIEDATEARRAAELTIYGEFAPNSQDIH